MTDEEFERLFRAMQPRLRRRARRRLDAEGADEAAIDALRVLWQKSPGDPRDDEEERQLRALLYRILDGIVANRIRAGRRHARLIAALIAASQTEAASDAAVAVADAVVRDDLFARLPARDREVLALLVDGYSVAEIAQVVGRSPGAVSMRLARARERLLWAGTGTERASGKVSMPGSRRAVLAFA